MSASPAAAATTEAVPPLRLLQALPLQAAAAAAAPPSHPGSSSYQLSDSHESIHLASLADFKDGITAGPCPAAAATAAAQQQPWTQNTARALRRTQQEVAELCAAGGLPLPAERAYCFDLVGIREAGFGTSSHSMPLISSSSSCCRLTGNGASSSSAEANPSRTDAASWSNCTTEAAGHASAAAAAAAGAAGRPQQQIPHTGGVNTGATEAPVKTSSSHGGAPEQPHQTVKGLSQRQQQQQQQHRQHSMSASGVGRVHSNHGRASPCGNSSSILARSIKGKAAVTTQAAGLKRSTSSSIVGGVKPPLSLLRRVEQSLAVHAGLKHQPLRFEDSNAGAGIRGDVVQAAADDMVGVTSLPRCWWEAQERPLSDPLLLCLPLWVREALELELMEV